jgi:hypothetical protein
LFNTQQSYPVIRAESTSRETFEPSSASQYAVTLLCAMATFAISPAFAADTPWISSTGAAMRADLSGSEINSLALSGDGKSLMGPAKLVAGQVVAGTRLDAVTAIALSPDGKRLAVSSEDVSIHLFDIASGKPLLKLDHGPFQGVSWVHGPAKQMVFTPNGARIVSFEQGNNLVLHDATNGKQLGGSVQVRRNVAIITPIPDGGGLWIAEPDGTLQRWQWLN